MWYWCNSIFGRYLAYLHIHQCGPFGEWLFIFPTQCQSLMNIGCRNNITLSIMTLMYNPVHLTSAHNTALLLTGQSYRNESSLPRRFDIIWTRVVKAFCQKLIWDSGNGYINNWYLYFEILPTCDYSFAPSKREFPVQNNIDFVHMMTSPNGNIFRVTGHLCGEFTGRRWIPRTKASDAELWCFLWFTSEYTVE